MIYYVVKNLILGNKGGSNWRKLENFRKQSKHTPISKYGQSISSYLAILAHADWVNSANLLVSFFSFQLTLR